MFNIFKKHKETKQLIERQKDRILYLEEKLKSLENDNSELSLKLQEGSYISNTKLLEQNDRLIEWIQKILNEVGTCRVNNMHTFTIPIMYNEKKAYNSEKGYGIDKEYIQIPAIEIIRTKIF